MGKFEFRTGELFFPGSFIFIVLTTFSINFPILEIMNVVVFWFLWSKRYHLFFHRVSDFFFPFQP